MLKANSSHLFKEEKTFKVKRFSGIRGKEQKLKSIVLNTLGGVQVDWRNVVQLPEGEDLNEWLSVSTLYFYDDCNLLFGSLSELCTPASCPQMSAGSKYRYKWFGFTHGGTERVVVSLDAPSYVDHLMQWIENQLDDPAVFPREPAEAGPKLLPVVQQIFKRLFRVYAHIYHSHYAQIDELGETPYLNSSFRHFMLFIEQHRLVDKKELAPLVSVIRRLVPDYAFPSLKADVGDAGGLAPSSPSALGRTGSSRSAISHGSAGAISPTMPRPTAAAAAADASTSRVRGSSLTRLDDGEKCALTPVVINGGVLNVPRHLNCARWTDVGEALAGMRQLSLPGELNGISEGTAADPRDELIVTLCKTVVSMQQQIDELKEYVFGADC